MTTDHRTLGHPERDEFDARALELRQSGYTYRQIADELGCSISTAHHAAERARALIPPPNLEAVRADLVAMATFHYRQLAGIVTRALAAAEQAKASGDERSVARWTSTARLAIRDTLPFLERLAALQGANRPVPRFVEIKTINPEVLDAHLAELEDELRSRGYDMDSIPSVHDYIPLRLPASTVTGT